MTIHLTTVKPVYNELVYNKFSLVRIKFQVPLDYYNVISLCWKPVYNEYGLQRTDIPVPCDSL